MGEDNPFIKLDVPVNQRPIKTGRINLFITIAVASYGKNLLVKRVKDVNGIKKKIAEKIELIKMLLLE